MSRAARRATLLLLLIAITTTSGFGCLGRQVVGVEPPPEAEQMCPRVTTLCSELDDVPPATPIDPTAFDPRDGISCAKRSDLPEPMYIEGSTRMDGLGLVCANRVIELAPDAVLEMDGPALDGARLHVRGGERSVLRLSHATGTFVYITLEGHAWLEIAGASSLSDLVVDASFDMEGPAVSISDSNTPRLAVRTGPRGELMLDRMGADEATMSVGRLTATDVTLTRARFDAGDALFGASRLLDAEAEVGSAMMIASSTTRLRVRRCGSLRLIKTIVNDAFFAGCTDAPAELGNGSIVFASQILGSVDVLSATVAQSVFAPEAESELHFEDGSVRESIFCGANRLTALAGSFLCVACDSDIPEIELDTTFVRAPQCPSLQAAAPLESVM